VPTDKQRRENTRRAMLAQLEARRQREAARKKITLITSIVGTVVLIAAIVVVIVIATGGSKNTPAAGGGTPSVAASAPAVTTSSSASPVASPSTTPVAVKTATGPSVSFDGVTVGGAADLSGEPVVTSKSSTPPPKLEYKDLVVGTGAAASPTSSVSVQYVGVLYTDGTHFDASWTDGDGTPTTFSLSQVVAGFTQGIGGTTGVPPMKIGGRRIVIMPAALGYGAAGSPPAVPANAPLVFVIDLKSVTAG
jgi:hypothetical protein